MFFVSVLMLSSYWRWQLGIRPPVVGYFPGRPMEPESGPAKTMKAHAGLHFKQHGLG